MNASVVAMGASLANLSLIYLRHRVKYPALLAYLASEVLYRAYELGWGLGYEAACWRECTYAGLGGLVAIDAWWRSGGPNKQTAAEVAAVGIAALAGAGVGAMGLPGAHADYRGLIPVALGAALCLVTAHWEASTRLDKAACWGLAAIFLAQATEYLGWEFHPSWANLGAWVGMGFYLWAMLEISLATKHG